jgi:poly(A) polymerase
LAQYEAYYDQFSNPVLFPKFGTAKVFLSGTHNGVSLEGMDVEAVAARKEVYTPGSRKPKVTPGTLEDDVFRRDFRANSLMMDLTTGQVHDLTGKGIEDIKNRVLVTTSDPEVIFREDPLRMMRAVRFQVQKGFNISPETAASIRKNAAWLRSISRERVRDEMDKILVTSDPGSALRQLRDLGLLPYIAPELQQAVGMTQNVHHVHDVFDHTLEVLKNTKPELVQRLIALFHDIGKIATRSESPTGVHFYGHEDAGEEIVDRILRNLKYPLDIINAVKMGVKNHMRLKQGGDDAVKISDKALRKFKVELGDNLENILDVIHADNTAHSDASNMPNQIEHVRRRLKALDIQVKSPRLPINGTELQQIFGLKPGPTIGKILSKVVDAWYDNPNITKEDAIEIARREIQ